MSDGEIVEVVSAFVNRFFGEEMAAAQKELDFLYGNGFVKPQLDYIKMRRFLIAAYNNLKSFDPKITEGLVAKVYQDVERLYDYLADFLKKTKLAKLVYVRDFLPSVPQYKALQDDVTVTDARKKQYQLIASATERELAALEAPKNAEELAYAKSLHARNVDAIDTVARCKDKLAIITKELKELEAQMSSEFFGQYDEYMSSIKDGLFEVTNTKSYYFDKLMWDFAASSPLIQKFFTQSRIEGDYSTKTMIRYYLRNIDIGKSNTSEWHKYLLDVLKVFE
ncbi:MAG: hypothetical protein LBE89_07490 [Helicobacteraceae bacterium]|nr:hypothetical protein [Helicobacteraceae bacterium]